MQSISDYIHVLTQHLLPHHLCSRVAGRVANASSPWLRQLLITRFVNHYQPNMQEAEEPNPLAYPSFNAFFTRKLRADARPINQEANTLVSPADGSLSDWGTVSPSIPIHAKGHAFSVTRLLGSKEPWTASFADARFMTVYLAPQDYHRVHMPCAGTLTKTIHIPGRLFSVNPRTVAHIPGLFARNERLVCVFETEYGAMAVIFVAAFLVAGISTVWSEGATHPLPETPLHLEKGAEIGRFHFGSTVILLLPPSSLVWEKSLQSRGALRMGQTIGRYSI